MAQQQLNETLRILRIKQIKAQTGLPNSTIYDHVKKGLFTRPIKLGERISGWLETEVVAIMGARIAGKSEAQIKELVLSLENQRVTNWG
jgi:prophage regulatory protein